MKSGRIDAQTVPGQMSPGAEAAVVTGQVHYPPISPPQTPGKESPSVPGFATGHPPESDQIQGM